MVGFIFECFLHSRFGLHTVFGCQRSCGLYDLSVSYLSIGSGKLTMTFVGLSGLEPETSPLSEARSNQLS